MWLFVLIIAFESDSSTTLLPSSYKGSRAQKCSGCSSSSFLILFSTKRLRLESVIGRL